MNLTAEQSAKIKEMRETQWKEMKPLQEQMFTKRDEIRKLWLEPNPDQAKITAAQKEMRSLRDQMEDRMTAYRLEAVKVLTPEQREKIGSFVQGRGHGRGHGFGPGARGGPREVAVQGARGGDPAGGADQALRGLAGPTGLRGVDAFPVRPGPSLVVAEKAGRVRRERPRAAP